MDLNLHRVMLVLLLYLTCYLIQLVTSQSSTIIRSPVNQSTCAGETVNFTCVVMFTSGPLGAASWITNDGNIDAITQPGHTRSDDSNGRSAPANVTTVLTVTNVSISDNGADYFCVQGFNARSDTVFLTVFGPPGDISGIYMYISPDTITACSFVVQWSEPSSDPVCGSVWYTVTISTEGGILIITDNTTMTNYDVTGGLNDNTVYHVNVTASNNAGSSSRSSVMITTNSNGLPSNPPTVTAVTPLSNTSFTVNWIISDPNYGYTVIWTNINTGVVDNITVPENTNSYTVTGLSVNDNYNVSVAIVGVCGMMTSDPITVYDPPTPPQFNYCISYHDGRPTLQVISHVTVTPMSSLTFSASYQTGNSNSQSATCSLLSDMQYNCTAEFAVDIVPSVDMIESMNVTVSGPYGSASLLKNLSQGVNAILSVDETEITENSAMLISSLPCFSPNLECALTKFRLIQNNMDVNVTNSTNNVTGSLMAYSYPTHTITVTGLNSDTTYNYCIVATDMTNMMEVGESMCSNFTTMKKGSNGGNNQLFYIIAVIAAVVIVIIVVVIVLVYWCRNGRRSSKVDERRSSKLPLNDNPLGDNMAYGITSSDDKKNTTSAETRMQENLRNEGTIKDDRIDSTATSINSTTASNVQPTKDTWYDKLASDDDDKIKKSDNGNPVTNERELVPERVELPANDSIKPHPFYQAEEASRAQLEQRPLPSVVNQNEMLARSNEESTLLQTTIGTTTTTAAMITTTTTTTTTTTAMTTTGATTATTNSNRDKRPPVTPINFYDPIQQHPPAIPHLNTSSGHRYALPSPKSSRASKQTDTTTPANKEIPPYATPDKSKKTANQKQLPAYAVPDKSKKKTKYTELDVLPSPTSDDTKPLTDQKVKYTDLDILPSPTSDDTKPLTD